MSTPDNAFADEIFATVAAQLLHTHPDDEQGRMLRSPGLRTGGKFYGFATADDLVVKLPAGLVQELIERGDGLPCSPRPGRPMREWVCIPAPGEESCRSYLVEARAFVSATPPTRAWLARRVARRPTLPLEGAPWVPHGRGRPDAARHHRIGTPYGPSAVSAVTNGHCSA